MKATFTIGDIRINSIQSGASFIIAESVTNYPTSNMVMQAGPGSMNNGDENFINNPNNDSNQINGNCDKR
ncbi:MAG: hypothetical protein H0Z39_09415 [Peptococcaceae bacterium]|nr:hypothetical protein [Peptococcaceae bacterium]